MRLPITAAGCAKHQAHGQHRPHGRLGFILHPVEQNANSKRPHLPHRLPYCRNRRRHNPPWVGIVEADEIDYKRCLEVQLPYLGPVEGHYTDWTPLDGRPGLFPEDLDTKDPWQFKNILVRS